MPSGLHILTIGSINMDLAVRCSRLPTPGETIHGTDLKMGPGGKGANQAVAVARLGARSTLVGRVGEDLFGPRLKSHLEEEGIDTSFIEASRETASGVAMIHIDAQGENAITAVPGANHTLRPADIAALDSVLTDVDALLLQLEIPLETAVEAVRLARRRSILTVLDPAPVPPEEPPEELLQVDLLTPNQSEAARLTGQPQVGAAEASAAATALLSKGPRMVVLKLGKEGALCCSRTEQPQQIPAFAATVVDTTGAGDAFTAALATRLAEGASLVEATRFACVAGALATTRLGAQGTMPTRDEITKAQE